MTLTTTCNAEEYTAIESRAKELGIQITAAPGFIYKKGNWIVGGTQEDEGHFNARVPSKSVRPNEFLCSLDRSTGPHVALAIVCDYYEDVNTVVEYFRSKGYSRPKVRISDGLAIFVIPAEKGLMVTYKSIAMANQKEGYPLIDFEVFKTIVG